MDEAKKRLAGRMRAIYLRLMSTGIGALALTPSSQLSGDSGAAHQGTVVAPVVNRDKRTAAKKLILSLATGERVFMASHRSHSSHSSHSSHYSSSGGGWSPAPAPTTAPPGRTSPAPAPAYQPPPPAKEPSAPERSALQFENVIEVTKIDEPHHTLTGKDRFGTSFTFSYRSATKVHRLSPLDETLSLSAIGLAGEAFPVVKDQEVLVNWVAADDGKTRIAVKLTILE